MSGAGDPVMQAAARLEAAVEQLARALARPRPGDDGVPRAEVAALTARLDATIGRLRAALHDEWAAEQADDGKPGGGPDREE